MVMHKESGFPTTHIFVCILRLRTLNSDKVCFSVVNYANLTTYYIPCQPFFLFWNFKERQLGSVCIVVVVSEGNEGRADPQRHEELEHMELEIDVNCYRVGGCGGAS